MPLRLTLCLLFACLLLPACESVRTVYDENGNVVKEDERDGAQETDLFSAYEKRFNEAFSEKRNAQGVPEAKSSRVSRYQRELDAARNADSTYSTKSYGGLKSSNLRDQSYGGSKSYAGSKSYSESRVESALSRDMQPAYMNESHGIAHEQYKGSLSRSGAEGNYTSAYSSVYGTHASSYTREQESGYFESLRNHTPAPPIYDSKTKQMQEILRVRTLLGRDRTDAE